MVFRVILFWKCYHTCVFCSKLWCWFCISLKCTCSFFPNISQLFLWFSISFFQTIAHSDLFWNLSMEMCQLKCVFIEVSCMSWIFKQPIYPHVAVTCQILRFDCLVRQRSTFKKPTVWCQPIFCLWLAYYFPIVQNQDLSLLVKADFIWANHVHT